MAPAGGPKICLIGAGGMSFGPVMVLDAVNARRLRGATLMLHDISAERLEVTRRFAVRVNEREAPRSPSKPPPIRPRP